MPPGVFVDSNVFVYSLDTSEPHKRAVAQQWLDRLWSEGAGRLSGQVVNESYWNATRRLDEPIARAQARTVIRKYVPWLVPAFDEPHLAQAWQVEERFGLAWWDALIVAAAQRAGCGVLLTEDMQDGQDFDGVKVVDPFVHDPSEFLGDAEGVAERSAGPYGRRPRRPRPPSRGRSAGRG